MKSLLCAVLIFFIYFTVDSGSALRCYYCSSFTGYKDNCEVNVQNKTVATMNCTTGYTTCMTLRLNNTITRSCAVKDVCQMYKNVTGFKSCSTCVTNLCNDRSSATATSLGLLAALFTATTLLIY